MSNDTTPDYSSCSSVAWFEPWEEEKEEKRCEYCNSVLDLEKSNCQNCGAPR